MTTAIKRRRGTTTQHSSFTGLEGELTVDTTKDTVVVHDGSTAGGFALLREDLSNNTNVVTLAGTQTLSNKTFSDNPVLSAGTANGVAYLNGSKVLTTGSALTFDGTNFAVGSGVTGGYKLTSYTSSGNNGISIENGGNTGSDYAVLDFRQASTQQAVFYTNSGNLTSNVLSGANIFQIGSSEQMRLTSTGLGIGTSSPTTKLQVTGSIKASQSITIGNVAGGNYEAGSIYADGNWGMILRSATNAPAGGAAFAFMQYGGTESMRIDTSGNVGIGTSSPGQKLDVRGRTQIINSAAGTATVLNMGNDDTSGTSVVKAAFTSSGAIKASINAAVYGNDYMTFNVGSDTERMRIDSSGNLLVGTTSVISQGKTNIAFNGTGNQGLNLQETNNQASAGFMYFQYNTTILGTITRDAATNAVKYNTTSDQRLKENIVDSNAALPIVNKIKVRQYDWIGCENSHQDFGFIAQELAQAVNNVVTEGRTEADMWAVDYGKLTPLLVKAIQELKAELDATMAEVAALKAGA